MGRLSRVVRGIVVMAGFGAVVLGGGSVAFLLFLYPHEPGPGDGQQVVVDIPRGGGPALTARLATSKGAVRQKEIFAAYLRLSGLSAKLQAGRHVVHDDWTPAQVAAALTTPGETPSIRIVHREGASRLDLADELDRQGVVSRSEFLEATKDQSLLREIGIPGDSAEGYLFPETYFMKSRSSPAAVLRRLVQTFSNRTASLIEQHDGQVRLLGQKLLALEETLQRQAPLGEIDGDVIKAGRHAAVILASMVEAETALPRERPLVAAVLLNRLTGTGFPLRILQIDPTISYGCRLQPRSVSSCTRGFSPLTKAHLEDRENRYNTYVHPGLPPGPIGNPSESSLAAVLNPAQVQHLYFVADGAGGHVFSDSLQEHNRAVQRYRHGKMERER